MSKNDGGAAFPSPGVVLDESNVNQRQQGAYEGMTLRDYFAGKALQGYIVVNKCPDWEIIAQVAYGLADAMLAERAK